MKALIFTILVLFVGSSLAWPWQKIPPSPITRETPPQDVYVTDGVGRDTPGPETRAPKETILPDIVESQTLPEEETSDEPHISPGINDPVLHHKEQTSLPIQTRIPVKSDIDPVIHHTRNTPPPIQTKVPEQQEHTLIPSLSYTPDI